MDLFMWAVLIVIGIGVLVISIPLWGLALLLWWIALPIIGAYLGGWIGFFFGVGLDVIIYTVYLCSKSVNEDIKEWSKSKKRKEVPIPKQNNIKLPTDVITRLKE